MQAVLNSIKSSLCSFIKGIFLFKTLLLFGQQNYAPHGNVFTPKGDIRFLIICAGFKGFDAEQTLGKWGSDDDLPQFFEKGALAAFYSDTSEFEQYKTDTSIANLSKLYFEMSNKKDPFKVVADVYPTRINVKPDEVKGAGWGAVNKAVLKQLIDNAPNFNWGKYDNRINRPQFKYDNSVTGSDGKPDYIIILYRYDTGWEVQPIKGMNGWLGGANGASSLSVGEFDVGEYRIGSDGFFCHSSTSSGVGHFMGMFKHELGHELFSGPHYMGANSAFGNRFYSPSGGWGSTVSATHLNNTINAWERWVLGWLELKKDIEVSKKKSRFWLNDFATTHEAVRIQLPNASKNYLWLENHQSKSIFDHNELAGELIDSPKGSSGFPDIDKGVYAYVENMLDDRSEISTRFVYDMDAVNGINLLNAQGNYDYEKPTVFTQTTDWSVCWNNKLYHFKRGDENPFSGINPFYSFRHDFDDSGKIEHQNNFNGGKGESQNIVMELEGDSVYLFYGNHGGRNKESLPYRRSAAFITGDELSISSNPALVNYPKYDNRKDSIEPIFLNGLKVSLVKEKKGRQKIIVSYTNFKLKKDIRLAGNIAVVKGDFKVIKALLTINKSGTVSRLNPQNGSFISKTYFTLSDSSSLRLKRNSRISVYDDSEFILSNNSTLIASKTALIQLYNTSQLRISEGAVLNLKKEECLTMHDDARLFLEKGSVFNGQVMKVAREFTAENRNEFLQFFRQPN